MVDGPDQERHAVIVMAKWPEVIEVGPDVPVRFEGRRIGTVVEARRGEDGWTVLAMELDDTDVAVGVVLGRVGRDDFSFGGT